MGGAGLLLPEEPPLSVDTVDGRFFLQKKSDDERLAAKTEAADGFAVTEDAADDGAHFGDPLIRFLDLAERQSRLEPASKRMKSSAATPKAFDVGIVMKHVADIVLALAGLGLIRGGQDPTQEERRLQAEAYGHLGFLVQGLGPKDLVPQDAINSLIGDLGLRKPEAQVVKTFEQMLEEFQPMPSVQMADSGLVGIDATTAGRSMENSDPQKNLLSASRLPQSGIGSSDRPQSELASQRHVEGGAVPSQHEGEAAGSHTDFMQVIQNLLQPRYPPGYTFQAAHSRDFMGAAMPCEMCKVIVRETANVLVCDTCEKVFHLRCLQSYLMTGIPKGDWHCPSCSEVGKEKTRPPKYGRVKAGFSFADPNGMLRKSSAKGPSTTPKAEQVDGKGNTDVVDSKGNIGVVDSVTLPSIQKLNDRAPDSSTAPQKAMNQGNSGGSFIALLDSFSQAEGHPSSKFENAGQAANHLRSSRSQVQATTTPVLLRSRAGQSYTMAPSKPQSQALRGARGAAKTAQKDKQSNNTVDLRNQLDTGRGGSAEKPSNSVDNSGSLDEPSVGSEEERNSNKLAKETDRFGVEWLGDALHVHDGSTFYSACTVGGYPYRLQDCALFRPETPNVPPYIARLQALWEDASSGEKWVRVNWCYYPADMAMLPGRPANPEVHEVYESNHGDNNLAGTIQGQCMVLQPESYAKEMERRQEILKGGNTGEGLVPVFLSRWLYDVAEATFRPTPGAL